MKLSSIYIIQMNDGLYTQKAFASFEQAISILPLKWSCMMTENRTTYEVETGVYILIHRLEMYKG